MSIVIYNNNIFNELEFRINARQDLHQKYSLYAITDHALKGMLQSINDNHNQPIQLREIDITTLNNMNGNEEEDLIRNIINVFLVCLENPPEHPELHEQLKIQHNKFEQKTFEILELLDAEARPPA